MLIPKVENGLLVDMERWSRAYALRTLEKLGWKRRTGEVVNPEDLRQRLGINEEHARLFRRLFEMLANSGVLDERGDDFVVVLGDDDALPVELRDDPEKFHVQMAEKYSQGLTEIGLFRRSGAALADVLRGQADPLTLLFSSGEPTAADLYLKAPVARAANRMLADAVAKLVSQLPDDRRLRVLEIGAGTGSATASVLPELPEGRFDYVYTDISAGFFAEAEARFGDANGSIQYRPLDIEEDPIAQGFASHGYDILIASNVLHANALPRRDARSLSNATCARWTFDRVGKPARAGLDGLDIRSIGRMVAVRRRVSSPSRFGRSRCVASSGSVIQGLRRSKC